MIKGLDISHHQTAFDAEKAKAAGIGYVACRCAYAESADSMFSDYAAKVRAAGMTLGAYGYATWHYADVCGTVDALTGARSAMERQISAWIALAKKAGVDGWFGIDIELENGHTLGLSPGDMATVISEAAERLSSAGLHPVLYASISWLLERISTEQTTIPLWVARYYWDPTDPDFGGAGEGAFPGTGAYTEAMERWQARIVLWQFGRIGCADKYGCTHTANNVDRDWVYRLPAAESTEPELAIFPMRWMRTTQDENGSYSHAGSLAMDEGGQSPSTDDAVLAPFSGRVARTRRDSSHETYYQSSGDVKTPCGYVGPLTLTSMHDNVLEVAAGDVLAQGALIGHEGGFGYGHKDMFPHHAHLEISRGRQTTQAKNAQGTYCTPDQMHLYDAFYLSPDTMVCIRSANGRYDFKRADTFGGAVKDLQGHVWQVAGAASTDKPIAAGDTVVTTSALNVRRVPAMTGARKAVLAEGTRTTVWAVLGSWGYVAADAGDGWVCLDYVRRVS